MDSFFTSRFFNFLIAFIFCVATLPSTSTHQRQLPKAFDGTLYLTHAPRIGGDATLVLSIRSNLAHVVQGQIWFSLPCGLSPRSTARFNQVYLHPHAEDQQYSLRACVKSYTNDLALRNISR